MAATSADRWQRSPKTRSAYAAERRLALVKELSPDGRCALCKERCTHDKLEVDHVDGCTWNKRQCNAWTRYARYWREYKTGIKLRALCRSCNGTLGAYMRGRPNR